MTHDKFCGFTLGCNCVEENGSHPDDCQNYFCTCPTIQAIRQDTREQKRYTLITAKDCFQSLGVGGIPVLIRELEEGLDDYRANGIARGDSK